MMDTLVRPCDVIAVYVKDAIAFFARVEEIVPDVKPGWRNMRFLVLADPLREVTWTLEPVQIDGKPFTMGGTPIRIERIPETPSHSEKEDSYSVSDDSPPVLGKVIAFQGRAKK